MNKTDLIGAIADASGESKTAVSSMLDAFEAAVTDAVAELLDELPRLGRATFAELTADLVERIEVIVRFLAVLELFKQGWIDLEQPQTLGMLSVVWKGADDVDAEDLAFVDAYDG